MIQSTQELLDAITDILSKAKVKPEVIKNVTDVVSAKINAVASDQLNAALDAAVAPAVRNEVGNVQQQNTQLAKLNAELQQANDTLNTRLRLIAERLKADDVVGAISAATLVA